MLVFIFETPNDLYALARNTPRYLLAPAAAVVGAIFLGARYLQDIYELPHYGMALHYLFASLFDGPPYGLFLPSLTVSGESKADDGASLLDLVGGPGWLTVEPGHVVLLEQLQCPTEVLSAGTHFIPRLMRVQGVFSLEDQHWKATPVIATTKDGIEVAVHDFQFTYRLYSTHRENFASRRSVSNPYPFSKQAVYHLAYSRAVRGDGVLTPWGSSMQFRVDGKITEFINKHTLDQIITPSDQIISPSGHAQDPRETIMQNIQSPALRDQLKNFLGTELTWANIGRFEINDETIREYVKRYRLDSWFAQWAGSAALILAQGKAEQISQNEGGRSESTATMLKSIIQALDEADLEGEASEHMWSIVLARTAQVIESMTSVYDLDLTGFSDETKREKHD